MEKLIIILFVMAIFPKIVFSKELAVTIDDLPIVHASAFTKKQQEIIFNKILNTLDKFNIKIVGFVIGKEVASHNHYMLNTLLAKGHLIGNHTYSHPYYKHVTIDFYCNDVMKGEKILESWLSEPKYFRYPMLHQGETQYKKETMKNFLLEKHYAIAHVSIDNDEWMYNDDYEKAFFNQDKNKMKKIGINYLEHMKEKTYFFELMANNKLGRNIKHVLLIHMNLLNSDYLEKLLEWYKKEKWNYITLQEALSDPVYKIEDQYIGDRGISFLERIYLHP
ncbi:MAG: hypothetical protein A2381_19615 [Bdellovibrionales bacterium RIFOXYB1_FULL_37_110]|nr:MAG: hypothetical protein A2417_11115 [Bdellovibrionales bacterium RIFOXYC1_FULL_37_79]OFZ60688.1 MAG: hypothetical protein A2381_19615 [Bdellovibrionales bacterium RIFOXYB1_FULL_37_110]OFZ64440.1 MAG: hypothetical protein A2577_10265 [Bdellovibrionales bacterium RIFOXYD1_FULL_36_51]